MTDELPFYVYACFNNIEEFLYIGHGTGNRCFVSRDNKGTKDVIILARFKTRKEALAHEYRLIYEHKPKYNISLIGGNWDIIVNGVPM